MRTIQNWPLKGLEVAGKWNWRGVNSAIFEFLVPGQDFWNFQIINFEAVQVQSCGTLKLKVEDILENFNL